MNQKILVLGGGDSPEREVSLRSAKAVASAAREAGYEVLEADPSDGYGVLDSISKDSVVLPILHGAGGEDGVVQAELDKRGLPYLGADSLSSKNCFDKWLTREMLVKNDIPMASAVRVNKSSYVKEPISKKPHVLKVQHGGSSIGTLMVRDPSKLSQTQVDEIFGLEDDAVVEELIEGIEITVPILDKSALMPLEIQPPESGEFDYENKYNGATKELCPPPSLNQAQIKAAQGLAEKVHRVMDCRHLSRIDIILDKSSNFYVLEINTIPGLTNQSLFPKSAVQAGYDMPALVTKFVEIVKRDYAL